MEPPAENLQFVLNDVQFIRVNKRSLGLKFFCSSITRFEINSFYFRLLDILEQGLIAAVTVCCWV